MVALSTGCKDKTTDIQIDRNPLNSLRCKLRIYRRQLNRLPSPDLRNTLRTDQRTLRQTSATVTT